MKTKSKISGYIIRSVAYALFFLVTFMELSSAFNSPDRTQSDTGEYDRTAKIFSQPRAFSFAERVAYQRVIEDVYWRHRIWPRENPGPKPSLDAVMSQAQLEKKVGAYLRDSQALEDYWQKPITAEQLQAEIDRTARDTKQPGVLRELFEALKNDPAVIAECLARPILAERLIANLSGRDEAWYVASLRTDALSTTLMATTLAQTAYTLPEIADACTDDTWTATTTINASAVRESHTAVWTGSEMIVWGGFFYDGQYHYLNTGGRYNPTTDSWTATSTTNAPSARDGHTTVWTGSEMIVWGGQLVNTGGKYNPVTDTWTATSTINTPSARTFHKAVWTGDDMIVWGGAVSGGNSNTGGRYNPTTDAWTATTTTSAPDGRYDPAAVWTGSEMVVWGGTTDGLHAVNTGGRYNPGTDSWTATTTANAPAGRRIPTAVWTGSEMIIWGGSFWDGQQLQYFNSGGRYNPSTDSWTATSITNAPSARDGHTAVWTGSEIIVWGGGRLNTGGRYNPATDNWTLSSTSNAPTGRTSHSAVWTGREMIVWGGFGGGLLFLNTGGRYCAQAGPTHPDFFSGEVFLGNGVYYLQLPNGNLFGYYAYLSDPRWIYHFDMGYEYWFDANDGQGGIFFYDFAANTFFYTGRTFPFPYLYDFGLGTVLYYYPDPQRPGHYTTNPRYFYNFATGQIITR